MKVICNHRLRAQRQGNPKPNWVARLQKLARSGFSERPSQQISRNWDMAQQLKALKVLAEVLGSVPSTHTRCSQPSNSSSRSPMPSPGCGNLQAHGIIKFRHIHLQIKFLKCINSPFYKGNVKRKCRAERWPSSYESVLHLWNTQVWIQAPIWDGSKLPACTTNSRGQVPSSGLPGQYTHEPKPPLRHTHVHKIKFFK